MRCNFVSKASPEQVIRAYTDFSDRRLEIWRGTLKRENYALRESGDSWAVVREGSLKTGVVRRYEWAEPNKVRWSVLESSICDRGTGELYVRPARTGGSHVEILIEEEGKKNILAAITLGLKGLFGPLILPRRSKRALDRFAEEDQSAA